MASTGSSIAALASSCSRPAEDTVHDFHDKYILGQKLGRGAFAEVYATKQIDDDTAQASTGKAVKVRSGERWQSKKAIFIEEELWLAVSHRRNCVCLYEVFHGESLSYMVMERCDCSLQHHIKNIPDLTERNLGSIFLQMLQSLCQVHSSHVDVVHRDISGDNPTPAVVTQLAKLSTRSPPRTSLVRNGYGSLLTILQARDYDRGYTWCKPRRLMNRLARAAHGNGTSSDGSSIWEARDSDGRSCSSDTSGIWVRDSDSDSSGQRLADLASEIQADIESTMSRLQQLRLRAEEVRTRQCEREHRRERARARAALGDDQLAHASQRTSADDEHGGTARPNTGSDEQDHATQSTSDDGAHGRTARPNTGEGRHFQPGHARHDGHDAHDDDEHDDEHERWLQECREAAARHRRIYGDERECTSSEPRTCTSSDGSVAGPFIRQAEREMMAAAHTEAWATTGDSHDDEPAPKAKAQAKAKVALADDEDDSGGDEPLPKVKAKAKAKKMRRAAMRRETEALDRAKSDEQRRAERETEAARIRQEAVQMHRQRSKGLASNGRRR